MSFIAIVGVLFFLLFVAIAAYFVSKQKSPQEDPPTPDMMIHTSGIYSIVRKSPREDFQRLRPDENALKQYVKEQSVDLGGRTITDSDRKRIVADWASAIERNIAEIETGDFKSCDFYYYEFTGTDDVCAGFIEKGSFVTREEIFRHPELVPPFHAGCTCVLHGYYGTDNPRETTMLGMKPFFGENVNLPPLPDWKNIQKPE